MTPLVILFGAVTAWTCVAYVLGLKRLPGLLGALWRVLTAPPKCMYCPRDATTFPLDGGPGGVCSEHHWDQPWNG